MVVDMSPNLTMLLTGICVNYVRSRDDSTHRYHRLISLIYPGLISEINSGELLRVCSSFDVLSQLCTSNTYYSMTGRGMKLHLHAMTEHLLCRCSDRYYAPNLGLFHLRRFLSCICDLSMLHSLYLGTNLCSFKLIQI